MLAISVFGRCACLLTPPVILLLKGCVASVRMTKASNESVQPPNYWVVFCLSRCCVQRNEGQVCRLAAGIRRPSPGGERRSLCLLFSLLLSVGKTCALVFFMAHLERSASRFLVLCDRCWSFGLICVCCLRFGFSPGG